MNTDKISVFAERGEDGVYIFTFPKKGSYVVSGNNGLLENKGEELKINIPFPQERCIFAVTEESSGKKTYVSEKHIPMRGTPNFRDLGGIENKHGKQVKWGIFFRSGVLNRLTKIDLEYFKTLNIKTVIDFRSMFEVDREPEKFPSEYNVKYINSPVGNPADFEKLVESTEKDHDAKEAVREVMLKGATGFVDVLKDFQPVFDAMEADDPFLFHCSAGKDRTGLAAALILSTLDVDRETVLEDYLLSNKYTIPYFRKHLNAITDMGISEDIAVAASGVEREYLKTTLETIDQRFGSFDSMIEKVFGINLAKKQKLIEKFTI